MEISKKLASQIVTAIYEVVKRDCNLIDASGAIIGSTDSSRIGHYHAAGAHAAKSMAPVIVDASHPFEGARPGINYPIFLDHCVIAVIGITGNPKELHSYGFLITKITEVFLKEQQLNEELVSQNRALYYLVTSLIYGTSNNMQQLAPLLEAYHIDTTDEFAVLSVKLVDSSLEPSLRFYFRELKIPLSIYIYPNEWITIFTRADWERFDRQNFIGQYRGKLYAGAGDFTPFSEISRSYTNALTAQRHAAHLGLSYCDIQDISIALILDSLPKDIRLLYSGNLLQPLSEKERSILQTYFSQSQSLKLTSEILNIHKNTLQYQLDLITKKTGLNPRVFQDAFLLQFALLCQQ